MDIDVQPQNTSVPLLSTAAETVTAAVKPTNTVVTEIMDKGDVGTTAPNASFSMLIIVVVNSSVIVLLVCMAVIGLMIRKGRYRTPARPDLPQQPTQQQPQQTTPQQREVRPGGRQPSNHKPALPEEVITGQLLSPNIYDLIDEDLVGAEGRRQQPAVEMQPSTSQGVYGEVYEETRPKPCGPRTGYLHPIPAKEDVFADLTGHPQSPRRPASRPTSVPVACSNML